MLAYQIINQLNNFTLMMKEIDSIGSENVVNIISLRRIIIIDERANYNNGFILATSIGIKTDFNSKNNDSTYLSTINFKNFEAIVMQSCLTNSSKISYAKRNINTNQ